MQRFLWDVGGTLGWPELYPSHGVGSELEASREQEVGGRQACTLNDECVYFHCEPD